MNAACVLEKEREGAKIMHIFMKVGEERLRGKD